MTGCSCATRGKAAGLGPRHVGRDRRRHARHAAADRRRHHPARRPPRPAGLPSAGGTLPGRPLRAGGGGGNLRHPGRHHPPHRPRTRRRRVRPGDRAGPALDRYVRAGGTRRCSVGRWRCTRCAASRRIPTAFIPAAPSTCCRCCWARSIPPAPGATSRRSRGRSRAGPQPVGKGSKPNTMLPGMALGNPRGPEDLLIEDDGTPVRIDKAFTWDAPMSAHGLMHTLIANAHAGDPYKIDTLFMYMANMAWNSSMNPGEAARMMADKDPRPATTASRTSSIPTRSIPRRSPTPTWFCPTPPTWSAGTAFRCLTGRSAVRRARPIRSASRCCRPTATCARSRTC